MEHAIGYYQAKASEISTILDYATRWKVYKALTVATANANSGKGTRTNYKRQLGQGPMEGIPDGN